MVLLLIAAMLLLSSRASAVEEGDTGNAVMQMDGPNILFDTPGGMGDFVVDGVHFKKIINGLEVGCVCLLLLSVVLD